jgi:hypothetical protein
LLLNIISEETLTVLPVESIFTRKFLSVFCADDARMECLDRDVCARVLLGEMLDELVTSGFAGTVPDVAWLDDLACSGRDIDNDSWTGRRKRQELLDDVEGANHVGFESDLVVCCRDFSTWNKRMACCDVRDQDVNFADFLEDGRDSVIVGDGSGVRSDLCVGILGLEDFFRFAENLLSSLDKDEMLDASFGKGFRDGEADTTCLEQLVCELTGLRISYKPPPVTSTVLSFPSNVVDGEMRS